MVDRTFSGLVCRYPLIPSETERRKMVLSQNERLFSTPVNLFSFKEKLRERELKTKPNQLLDSDPVPPIKPTQGASESTGSACSVQQLLRQVASTERMPTAHKALFAHYCRVLCVEPGAAAGDIESAFNELATDDVRSSARGGDPAAVYLLSSLKLAKDTLLNDRVRERYCILDTVLSSSRRALMSWCLVTINLMNDDLYVKYS